MPIRHLITVSDATRLSRNRYPTHLRCRNHTTLWSGTEDRLNSTSRPFTVHML